MTSHSFEFAIGAYLLMGVVLLIRGPLNEALKDAVTTSVGTPFARAMTSRPVLPNYKIVILRVVLSLGILLLWPILLPGVLRENRRRLDHLKKHFGRPGLRFVRMGGEGTVSCRTCGYAENVVCSVHGVSLPDGNDWWATGYQCQSCGKFATVDNRIKDVATIECDCGGILSRDAALFCPKCKGHELDYRMLFIT